MNKNREKIVPRSKEPSQIYACKDKKMLVDLVGC